MSDNKNVALNDASMKEAAGGMMMENGQELTTITAIVTENPDPSNPEITAAWEESVNNGDRVYELQAGYYASAPNSLPAFFVGDQVHINPIRGGFGWEIIGVLDGPVVAF